MTEYETAMLGAIELLVTELKGLKHEVQILTLHPESRRDQRRYNKLVERREDTFNAYNYADNKATEYHEKHDCCDENDEIIDPIYKKLVERSDKLYKKSEEIDAEIDAMRDGFIVDWF